MLRKLVEESQSRNELMSKEYIARLEVVNKNTEETAQIASTSSVMSWLGL